ncbi:MAG: hypothetical protein QXL06_01900 [Nitrososphaerota archaeon]
MNEEEIRKLFVCKELSNALESIRRKKHMLNVMRNNRLIVGEDYMELFEKLDNVEKSLVEKLKRYKCKP